MIGVPPSVAAASDSNQICAAATSGAFSHWKLGNVDLKMGLVILISGIAVVIAIVVGLLAGFIFKGTGGH